MSLSQSKNLWGTMTYTAPRLGTMRSQNNLQFLKSPMTNHRIVSGLLIQLFMFSQRLLISWWFSFGFTHHVVDVCSRVSGEGTASIVCVTYSGLCRRLSIHAVQIKSPWRWRHYMPLECWKTLWWLSTVKVYSFATILYVVMWYIYRQL